ncbi:MAG: GAF domain-containing protein, partial [Gemmatimonadetes bacterium]|nr:GAF domain-containing protein [Gemmatimonadota bacterium]
MGVLDSINQILSGDEPTPRPASPPMGEERVRRLEATVEKLRRVLRGTAALNSALNYERVMDMALDLATSALTDAEAGGLVSALLLFDGDELNVVSSRGFLRADLNVDIPGLTGVVEQAMSTGQLEIISDPASDPELGRLLALRKCSTAVCIPLVVGLEVYGIMLFGHPKEGYLTEEGLEILES